MNPGAIAAVAALVARLINRKSTPAAGGAPQGPSKNADAYVGTWGVFVWSVIVPLGLSFLLLLLAGQIWAILPLAIIALIAFPWPISRVLLIPLGQARLA